MTGCQLDPDKALDVINARLSGPKYSGPGLTPHGLAPKDEMEINVTYPTNGALGEKGLLHSVVTAARATEQPVSPPPAPSTSGETASRVHRTLAPLKSPARTHCFYDAVIGHRCDPGPPVRINFLQSCPLIRDPVE